MINLFPDQEELLEAVRTEIRKKNRAILMQSPTGSGKTIVAASMIAGSRSKGTRCMMLVPRRELLRQTALTLGQYEIPFSYVASGYPTNPYAKTYIGTVQTLVQRLDKAPILDVLLIDECHYGGAELDKIITHYKAQGTYIIGLSATPIKKDGRGLDCWFDTMVCGKSVRWLMDNNRLSNYKLFQPSRPNLSKLKTDKSIDDYMMHDKVLIGDAARHYKKYAMGKMGISFSTSRAHSQKIVDEYNGNGISACLIDGTMDDEERSRITKSFARREFLQLVNCELCTFGYDLAAASGMDVCIETLTDLAKTLSLSRQLQKWGRVLRKKDEPALIFDHAGNSFNHIGEEVHGFPCKERIWSLTGRDKKNGVMGEKTMPVRQCPSCFYAHNPSPKCPNCGFVYPIQVREIEHVDGELMEIDVGSHTVEVPKVRKKQLNYLMKVARDKGIPNAAQWAAGIITRQMQGQ